jgi:hypothetical protein
MRLHYPRAHATQLRYTNLDDSSRLFLSLRLWKPPLLFLLQVPVFSSFEHVHSTFFNLILPEEAIPLKTPRTKRTAQRACQQQTLFCAVPFGFRALCFVVLSCLMVMWSTFAFDGSLFFRGDGGTSTRIAAVVELNGEASVCIQETMPHPHPRPHPHTHPHPHPHTEPEPESHPHPHPHLTLTLVVRYFFHTSIPPWRWHGRAGRT